MNIASNCYLEAHCSSKLIAMFFLFCFVSFVLNCINIMKWMDTQDSLAEWSKALAQGASPQGRGLEPHSCHFIQFILVSYFSSSDNVFHKFVVVKTIGFAVAFVLIQIFTDADLGICAFLEECLGCFVNFLSICCLHTNLSASTSCVFNYVLSFAQTFVVGRHTYMPWLMLMDDMHTCHTWCWWMTYIHAMHDVDGWPTYLPHLMTYIHSKHDVDGWHANMPSWCWWITCIHNIYEVVELHA